MHFEKKLEIIRDKVELMNIWALKSQSIAASNRLVQYKSGKPFSL